jgi:hypothetical protein
VQKWAERRIPTPTYARDFRRLLGPLPYSGEHRRPRRLPSQTPGREPPSPCQPPIVYRGPLDAHQKEGGTSPISGGPHRDRARARRGRRPADRRRAQGAARVSRPAPHYRCQMSHASTIAGTRTATRAATASARSTPLKCIAVPFMSCSRVHPSGRGRVEGQSRCHPRSRTFSSLWREGWPDGLTEPGSGCARGAAARLFRCTVEGNAAHGKPGGAPFRPPHACAVRRTSSPWRREWRRRRAFSTRHPRRRPGRRLRRPRRRCRSSSRSARLFGGRARESV